MSVTSTQRILAIVLCIGSAAIGALGHLALSGFGYQGASGVPEKTEKCRKERLGAGGARPVNAAELNAIAEGCQAQVHGELLLVDFEIRRMAFVKQMEEKSVLLVTVVLVTCAGVALSALQFLASYRMATKSGTLAGDATELAVEYHRVTLRSSVTGLVVLACSLAFFAVFASQVHPLREVHSAGQPSHGGEPQQTGSTSTTPTSETTGGR